jgi:hypothetical protein
MPSIQIVVTCSDRKRRQAPHRLRLRSLPQRGDRSMLWIERLKEEPIASFPAIDLYAGEHWSAVKGLMNASLRSGFTPDLWICSAGYGLVPANAELKPYSATFARGHGDSIDGPGDSARVSSDWWSQLGKWRGPAKGQPRSITRLAATRPRTPLLMVSSSSYLRALEEDVLGAGDILQDHLIVLSTGAKRNGGLREFLVPVDARFQHCVGGSRVGLNARVAAFLLEETRGDLDRRRVFSMFDRASKRLPAIPVYERTPINDEQAIKLIRRTLRTNGPISATSALQRLRSEGWACEQKRFGDLFRAVKEESLGG